MVFPPTSSQPPPQSSSLESSRAVLQLLPASGCVSVTLSKLTEGFSAHCPRRIRISKHARESSVFDTDLWRISDTRTGPALVASMQTAAQHWERLLFASGDALTL